MPKSPADAEDDRLFRFARPIVGSGIIGRASAGGITFGTQSSSSGGAATRSGTPSSGVVPGVDVFDAEASVTLSGADEVGSSAILIAALLERALRAFGVGFLTPALVLGGFAADDFFFEAGVCSEAGVRFEAGVRL